MTDEERFQAWLDKVCARELPQNPMARIRTLAKELAEGAAKSIFSSTFVSYEGRNTGGSYGRWFTGKGNRHLAEYLKARWGDDYLDLRLLITADLLEIVDADFVKLTKRALDLLEEVEPATIFISYKRSESSAFALLVLARLKAAGLEPFLDLALVPGENWSDGLRTRIGQYDHLIVLLGHETLKSEVVLQEMQWALEAGLSIIPIWHNGFKYQSGAWDVPPNVDEALSSRHTIRVLEESALAYNNAIVELLNRFGITP